MAVSLTIFGSYFGYVEKLSGAMERLKQTNEKFLITALNIEEQYKKLQDDVKKQEVYTKSLNREMSKHEMIMMKLHGKQEIGQQLNTKEQKNLMDSTRLYGQLAIQHSAAAAALKSQNDQLKNNANLLGIAKSNGNKYVKVIEKHIKVHDELQKRLLKSKVAVDQISLAQDKNIALGETLSSVFGIGLFAGVAKFQNGILGLAKTKVMIDNMGGVVGALEMQWKSFQSTMLIVKKIYVGSLSTMRTATTTLLWSLGPIVAIVGVLVGLFYGLKYIFSTLWKENIGGFQSKLIAFMGALKNMFAILDTTFRQTLREWGPMLAPIFDMLLDIGMIMISILGPILKVGFAITKWIVEPFIKGLAAIALLWKTFKLGGTIVDTYLIQPFMKWLKSIDWIIKLIQGVSKMIDYVGGNDKKDVDSFAQADSFLNSGFASHNVVQQGGNRQTNLNNSPTVIIHGVDTNNQNAVARSSIQANQMWTQGFLINGVNAR